MKLLLLLLLLLPMASLLDDAIYDTVKRTAQYSRDSTMG
jgi:hypothetical protein